MTEHMKIKSWWSDDRKWFCILTDDGVNQATVSLTPEEAAALSLKANAETRPSGSAGSTPVAWQNVIRVINFVHNLKRHDNIKHDYSFEIYLHLDQITKTIQTDTSPIQGTTETEIIERCAKVALGEWKLGEIDIDNLRGSKLREWEIRKEIWSAIRSLTTPPASTETTK